MSYKKIRANRTSLKVNTSYEGERLEQKINRILNNKEPITDGAPLIYTDRKDGVLPEYDPRTDKWVAALGAMDYVSKYHVDKRLKRHQAAEAVKNMEKEKSTETKNDTK